MNSDHHKKPGETNCDSESALANSEYLTRKELLTRRMNQRAQLVDYYKDYYWLLMEELRNKHREFYMLYGKSPVVEENAESDGCNNNNNNNTEENGIIVNGNGHRVNGNAHCGAKMNGRPLSNSGKREDEDGVRKCAVRQCKRKAMPITSFCHLHILMDPDQKLYMPCSHVKKRLETGDIACGLPAIRSDAPLCSTHLQEAEKARRRALEIPKRAKKAVKKTAAASSNIKKENPS